MSVRPPSSCPPQRSQTRIEGNWQWVMMIHFTSSIFATRREIALCLIWKRMEYFPGRTKVHTILTVNHGTPKRNRWGDLCKLIKSSENEIMISYDHVWSIRKTFCKENYYSGAAFGPNYGNGAHGINAHNNFWLHHIEKCLPGQANVLFSRQPIHIDTFVLVLWQSKQTNWQAEILYSEWQPDPQRRRRRPSL